ncbi:hypothetical protein ACFE04_016056 [Oxalis oulophora]
MADTSQSENCKKTSFFGSPRYKLFFNETDIQTHLMTPTSVLDNNNNINNSPKPFSPFCNNNNNNPFCYQTLVNPQTPKSPKLNNLEPNHQGIGLALIKNSDQANNTNKMVLFGTKLRIQIPPPITESKTESAQDIKTGRLSVSEMELSEDYTCIISHGPHPKTTHIFDNCIVETYLCNLSAHHHHHHHHHTNNTKEEEKNFLSYCHTCKKNLEQTNDIYIYRGEKAFCSQECRYEEMVLDEFEAHEN